MKVALSSVFGIWLQVKAVDALSSPSTAENAASFPFHRQGAVMHYGMLLWSEPENSQEISNLLVLGTAVGGGIE